MKFICLEENSTSTEYIISQPPFPSVPNTQQSRWPFVCCPVTYCFEAVSIVCPFCFIFSFYLVSSPARTMYFSLPEFTSHYSAHRTARDKRSLAHVVQYYRNGDKRRATREEVADIQLCSVLGLRVICA